MDIMMRLKGAGFSVIANEFRQREKRLGSGLPLQDFVEIVLQGLPTPTNAAEKYANVSALVDLFEDMDINGDGTMEFDEFTSYCVDAGMVATRTKTANLKHRYVRNARRVIKTMNGSLGIEKVRWSPLFQQFLVVENAATSVKLFNADGRMVGDVRSQSTLLNAPPTEDGDTSVNNSTRRLNENDDGNRSPTKRGRESDRVDGGKGATATTANGVALSTTASTGIFVLDAAFLHKFKCLAMSTTDFVISFYSLDEPKHQQRLPSDMLAATARCGPSYDVLPKLTITTSTAQLLLRFCEESGLLFSAGNDCIVNVWKIEDDMETKTLWKRLLHHQEMIMDIVEIPQHDLIASCDLNHTIQLWDLHDCRSRGILVGHTRGIKHMVFSNDHDLLLTAGFEFDAYGWDLASRQVVTKLIGHRAPLVGVHLARFQTERAVTADASGVFKVWDISRATGSTSQSAAAGSRQSGGRGSASQAVLLESLDPTHELPHFEPTTFISLHPQRRDLWTAVSGSSTLHLFRSMRVQQFDEIPLKAFYHYNANRFVVVSGPVCSLWDGETGSCVDEFSHVGASVGAAKPHNSGSGNGSAHPSSGGATGISHSRVAAASGVDSSTDILLCVQDSKCKKLVVLSEDGDMGVFNCQNLVQMRRCEETFRSLPSRLAYSRDGTSGSLPPPSCGIVGLHYCSENKLVIATDSHTNSICVIDDSNNDSSKGIKETIVLRRLVNIPGGVAASAYSYHASLIATLDHETTSTVSLWDFETLVSVGTCEIEEADTDAGASLSVLTFWDEYPVLLGADAQGGIYFFAVMPTMQAKTGKLLHAFVNNHALTQPQTSSTENEFNADVTGSKRASDESNQGGTFVTEQAEVAARKFLLKRRSVVSAGKRKSTEPSTEQTPVLGGVVTCMQVVFDDEDGQHRYLLLTGDEKGVIRVWNLSDMMRRLSLFKIPESNCKYLRRGYHPRAIFSHDCGKQTNPNPRRPGATHEGGTVLSAGDVSSDTRARLNQAQLKRLTKQRADAKKQSSATASSQLAKLLPANRVIPGQAPPAATTVAVAEAFLVSNPSLRRSSSAVGRGGSSRSSSVDGSTIGGNGALIHARARADENRRRSHCWQNRDVTIVNAWVAHADGITSMEVSKHPNIVVTCALDMRVFIWSWQGACLGKLFDADNVGPGRWRFRKDDSKRDAERQLLIDELLQELELPPQQKAHRRRLTLYQSHVQRKRQNELPHVSVMLLDHIVSQHPEVAAMEQNGLSNASTDDKINTEMEHRRQRNYRAKASMLDAIARASTSPAVSHSKDIVRMHSLAQVGPFLCVDKFEMEQERQVMKFAEKDELTMDRQYLESELGVGSSSAPPGDPRRGSFGMGNLASIKNQIRHAQLHAEDMMENKVALERHASAMYRNLHQTKRKNPQQHTNRDVKQSGINLLGDESGGEDTKAMSELEQLLEPSPFLRRQLPEQLLSLRPQTAPSATPKTSLTRAMSSSSIRASPGVNGQRVSSVKADSRKAKQLRPLTSSASESSLHSPSVSTADTRSISLNAFHIDEPQRQKRPANTPKPLDEESTRVDPAGEHHAAISTSRRKLEAINSIIDKAQGVCDTKAKYATKEIRDSNDLRLQARPSTAPLSSEASDRNLHRHKLSTLSTLHETDDTPLDYEDGKVDEILLRRHIDATRHRMEIAMTDSDHGDERRLLNRSLIDRKRHDVAHHKKGKRMEDYLHQKRREMNSNIGAVFRRTSFAFPSSAASAMSEGGAGVPTDKGKKKIPPGTTSTSDVADHRAVQEAQAQVEKSKVFGIYSVKEVMSVVRLFRSMDDDCSGTLTLAELLAYKSYFEKLGYHDMATVFQAIDKDGSGSVSLKELLEICFQYANKYQVEEMLKLAKLGDVASYFDATRSQRHDSKKGELHTDETSRRTPSTSKSGEKVAPQLSVEERAELLAIFRVFDRNGDGGIGMDEILEALHVEDEDETMARVAAVEEAQLATRDAASAGKKRRPSIAPTAASSRPSASAFTKSEVRQFYQDVDTDGDQSLTFEEFLVLMQLLHGSRR